MHEWVCCTFFGRHNHAHDRCLLLEEKYTTNELLIVQHDRKRIHPQKSSTIPTGASVLTAGGGVCICPVCLHGVLTSVPFYSFSSRFFLQLVVGAAHWRSRRLFFSFLVPLFFNIQPRSILLLVISMCIVLCYLVYAADEPWGANEVVSDREPEVFWLLRGEDFDRILIKIKQEDVIEWPPSWYRL